MSKIKFILLSIFLTTLTYADDPVGGYLDQLNIDWSCEHKGRLITSDNCILSKVSVKEKELKELYLKLKKGA